MVWSNARLLVFADCWIPSSRASTLSSARPMDASATGMLEPQSLPESFRDQAGSTPRGSSSPPSGAAKANCDGSISAEPGAGAATALGKRPSRTASPEIMSGKAAKLSGTSPGNEGGILGKLTETLVRGAYLKERGDIELPEEYVVSLSLSLALLNVWSNLSIWFCANSGLDSAPNLKNGTLAEKTVYVLKRLLPETVRDYFAKNQASFDEMLAEIGLKIPTDVAVGRMQIPPMRGIDRELFFTLVEDYFHPDVELGTVFEFEIRHGDKLQAAMEAGTFADHTELILATAMRAHLEALRKQQHTAALRKHEQERNTSSGADGSCSPGQGTVVVPETWPLGPR